jgi:hypothetical protein
VIIYKTITTKVSVVEDIICDKCGKSCIGECGNFCGVKIECVGGYDSPVFEDESEITYHVCEHCISTWIKSWETNYKLIGSETNRT